MAACGDSDNAGKSLHTEHVTALASVGFGSGGDNYDANRPGYTAEAVERVASEIMCGLDKCSAVDSLSGLDKCSAVDSLKYHVLEIGAGTGKFTQLVLPKLAGSCKYLATDASENFLEVLEKKNLAVDHMVATADNILLPDRSVANVVCAQCFHWFSQEKDIKSIHRVLVPGGKLILIWNSKNFDEGWMQLFRDQRMKLFEKVGGCTKNWVYTGEWRQPLMASTLFKFVQHLTLTGITFEGDLEKIMANLSTVSVYNTLPPEERDAYLDELRQALIQWPGLDVNRMSIPFTTDICLLEAM